MRERLINLTRELMLIPGLSGHESRIRHRLKQALADIGLSSRTDRLGNLIATIDGDPGAPSVMLYAHMDQLGFLVRKVEADGLMRLERLGGVPERALAAQPMLICAGEDHDIPAVIANKAHHATTPEEKYRVVPYGETILDAGFSSAMAAHRAGVNIGTPVVYEPAARTFAGGRICGTSADDRAGCAVVVETARLLIDHDRRPTVHVVFSVQEEFNLRGAVVAAQAIRPDIAIQIDLVLATDTPDMAARGDVRLGGGPAMSLYSFHGRGTLNGTIPHPAMVHLFEETAMRLSMPLQRSVHVGALTDNSYVQLVGGGVAAIDMGFPLRYSHSANEMCDLADLEALTRLLAAAIGAIGPHFSLDPDGHMA